jgi:hypothetical protein
MNIQETIKRVIKEEYDNKYNDLKRFIIDSIHFEDYPNVMEKDKLIKGFEQFKEEYGFMVERYGLKKAFIEYLQGLPSWLDIPFYYDEIDNLLYSLGFDEVRQMDSDELSKYWYNLVSDIFLTK